MSSSSMITSTIGFPRIGPNREMKKALERFASVVAPDLRRLAVYPASF